MKDDEENSHNDVILRAMMSLEMSITTSQLADNEKRALQSLVAKLDSYYCKKMDAIAKKSNSDAKQKAINVLQSFLTDILVEINDVLLGNNDIYYFVSEVNKKLHDKDLEIFISKSKKK